MAPASFKPGQVGAGVAAILAALIAIISTGQVRVPLPPPATGKYVNLVPQGVLPWTPQPLKGVFEPNERLLHAVRLFEGQVKGAESVAFSEAGNMALLDRYGNLYEALLESGCGNGRGSSTVGDDVASSGSDGRNLQRNDAISFVLNAEPIARFGAGRPLGYHYDGEQNLIVCDSLKGLVKYDYDINEISILANRVSSNSPLDPGSEITYANDLAVASDGKVYFTSCSSIVPMRNKDGYYDTFKAWMMGLAQGLPQGRLMMYDPTTQETVVLAKGFYYANGVALAEDESYLVIAETDRVRLMRYWLEGPQAGTVEPLLENLPGAPDGVSSAPDGGFWVALVSPVPPIAKLLRDPTVRALYAWLPNWARPPLKKWGAVAKVSGDKGEVTQFLMDPTGEHISSVSAAVEHDGCLFLGNLNGEYVSYVDLGCSGDDNSCWCSCTCNGRKMETPVRLRPPEGKEGQQVMQGFVEHEQQLQQHKQQQQQHQGEQALAQEEEPEGQEQQPPEAWEEQQQQEEQQEESLQADAAGSEEQQQEGEEANGVGTSGGQAEAEVEGAEQVSAPAPSIGVVERVQDEL